MRNLIYVNMMRLKKNRIFRAGVAVSMAYVAFLLFMNYQEMTDSPETVIGQLNWYFLSTLPVASAFCSVFCGMFLGTEYSDGTMRNKLMVGHTRKEIAACYGVKPNHVSAWISRAASRLRAENCLALQ